MVRAVQPAPKKPARVCPFTGVNLDTLPRPEPFCDSAPAICGQCDLRAESPQVASCTRSDCPLSAREAA